MPLRFEPLLQQAREREVHVVAAEQDVLADGDALEREVAVLLGHRDQAEVGGAAADVADEDEILPNTPEDSVRRFEPTLIRETFS